MGKPPEDNSEEPKLRTQSKRKASNQENIDKLRGSPPLKKLLLNKEMQKNDSIMDVPTAVHLHVTGSTPQSSVAPTPAPQLLPTSTTTSSIPTSQILQQQNPVTPAVLPPQQQVLTNQRDDSNQDVEEVDTFYSFETWQQKEIKDAAKTPVSTPPNARQYVPKKMETPKKQDTG
uniref:Uncharacterized protein n=1 Tax=Panagrolaimus sp. JU765 TaxID=591449 RepID=A0AC34RHJ4_9BILA